MDRENLIQTSRYAMEEYSPFTYFLRFMHLFILLIYVYVHEFM